ncbi:MAG: DTW domain-containing protein [Myxococcales bacterium]|nr:DTW domain-containing protein [Myxococcales bacterium]
MSRRANADLRCARCRMLGGLCLCALLPALDTRTRLVLVIHRYEDRKPTNTGRLATECLRNSEVIVRGGEDHVETRFAPPAGTRPVLLFPDADAVPLDQLAGGAEPVTLIVPDGTWRQAQRVRSRVLGLDAVACATLPPGPPSRYRLRSEPRPGGLATMEAIARAFGILEGPAAQAALEHVFAVMVERTLWTRGLLAADAVTGGIPPGVTRDPRRPSSEP